LLGPQGKFVLGKKLAGPRVKDARVYEAEEAGFVAQEEILSNCERGNKAERLVNDGNSRVAAVAGRREMLGHSVDADMTRLGLVDTRNNFDESGFSGSVLPEESVHLPGEQIEIRSPEGVHAAEANINILQVQQRHCCSVMDCHDRSLGVMEIGDVELLLLRSADAPGAGILD
jgi:hypothetical protein